MENLLGYLLCALFGHNVTKVHSHNNAILGKIWSISLEERVVIVLDETDLKVIRDLYCHRYDCLDDETRARYKKIFDACI